MPKQPAIKGLRDTMKKKVIRREQFLAEMDLVISWRRLLTLIAPYYLKVGSKGAQATIPIGTMPTLFASNTSVEQNAGRAGHVTPLVIVKLSSDTKRSTGKIGQRIDKGDPRLCLAPCISF